MTYPANAMHSTPPVMYAAVNLRAPLVLAQEAGRRMVPQKSGNIVNISSIWGLMAAPGRIAYCVSKAAIAQMTRCLADEWGPHGIRVNAIAPGYIDTDMVAAVPAAMAARRNGFGPWKCTIRASGLSPQ